MKNIIVGTAGHIDHGKTALVQALTGINADRLAEEQRRGITIDLGFAHLQLTPEIRLGFVDVPGHERFVRNMLAGVGGIDLVLLVVAADHSIQPQTREHFDICRMLGICYGMVVLTKTDLVDADLLELVQLEVEEFVAGSFLQGAPILPVSSRTGAGIPELRSALQKAAGQVTSRNRSGPARLPVDRSFTMRGFGTVATGTLLSGTIAREQTLELLPPQRQLRVRGLQAYGRPASQVEAGTRAAINLADIQPSALQRGMVLAEEGRFEAATLVDCSVELLASARRLKNRSPVHFHAGASQIEARLRLFGREFLDPGQRAFARLHLREPAVLAPGDRFIVRQFSPVTTIGGGMIIDTRPPRERRIAKIDSRLQILSGQDETAKAALLIEESGAGMRDEDLGRRLAIYPAEALALARKAKAIVIEPGNWVVHRPWLEAQRARLSQAIRDRHQQAPLASGITRHDLKAQLLPDAPVAMFDHALAGMPEFVCEGENVRHRTHQVSLSADEQSARATIAAAFELAGLAVPAVSEVLAASGMDAKRSQTLLHMLIKEKVLIRVTGELVFHHAAIATLKAKLNAHKPEPFTVSTFKDWTGISRKYAVPLLEFLDREHVTVRRGDQRVIL